MPSNSVQNPLFRKVILPWYDTDAACILTGVFMLIVFAFSFAGISVALETPEGRRHLWVPCMLLILSTLVMTTIIFRMVRRRTH